MPARPAARRNRRCTGFTVSSAAFIAPNSTRRCAGSSGASAMPSRWRTALWICAALSRTCVWASASPCDTSPARATQSACRASSSAAAASACANSGSSGCGEVSAASRRPTSACAKAATRGGSGASGQRSSCSPDRIQRRGDARGQRFRRRQRGDLRMQPRKLPALHLQPQPQRVPPADVGAAVGVVADPARQDHRPRDRARSSDPARHRAPPTAARR